MNNKTKNILYLSILLVFLKWVLIWYLNINQNFIATVINNVEDWQYFTLIHNLSSLNFSPVFDENIIERKNLAFPVYSILFHAISFKFFNVYGFILIELLSIFIFIILLEKILKRINLDFNSSIFLILLIFCLPNIIQFFNLSNILYLNSIDDLYSLRIPRPLITNLYVFFFLYILITTKNIYQFNLKKLAIIGSLFAFMWGSFYYNLAISGVIFLLYYFSIIKKKNKLFTKIFKDCHEARIQLKFYQQCLPEQNEFLTSFYKNLNIEFEIFNFSNNILNYFSKTNLAITRSGSSMLAELINVKVPFISIPLPSSADNHQLKNAIYYKKHNYGYMIKEEDIKTELFGLISRISKEKSLLNQVINKQRQYSDKSVYKNIEKHINQLNNEKY